MNNVTAIISSDWHITEKTPLCRTDNYLETLLKKIAFIKKTQEKYDCPVLHAGDLFDSWKNSNLLLSLAITNLPEKMITIPGQHELPSHNLSLINKSNLNVLDVAQVVTVPILTTFSIGENSFVYGIPWGYLEKGLKEVGEIEFRKKDRLILMIHSLFQSPSEKENPYIEQEMSLDELFDSVPDQCVGIIAGDNHQTFQIRRGKRWFLSPGSILRMDADQYKHVPKIFLWYADTNELEAVEIPFVKDAVSREHIKEIKERDARIESFINKISTDYKITLSFEHNLKKFFRKNNTRKSVQEFIWEVME